MPPTSDDPPPSTVTSTLFRFGIRKQPLLRGRALAAQTAALANRERLAELRFHQPGQRQIQIVAAQQQVLADGGAREIDAIAFAGDADQREVAGAAADVADQNRLAVEQAFLRTRQIVGDPGIERRGRFFEQRQLFDAGFARGHHGQLARLFVEAGGDGQDHVVFARWASRAASAHASARCFRIRVETSTGESTRPASCASHGRIFAVRSTSGFESQLLAEWTRLGGNQRALLARVDADVFLIAQIQKRRQRAPRLDAARARRTAGRRAPGWRENPLRPLPWDR